MSSVIALEERLAYEVRTTLTRMTDELVPEVAHPLGIARWMRTLAVHTVGSLPLEVGKVSDLAFRPHAIGRQAMAKRFAAAKFRNPYSFIIAYRAAALAMLRSLGAPLSMCSGVLQLSTSSNLYQFVERAERIVVFEQDRTTAAAALHVANLKPIEWGFRRYVRPVVPRPDDRRWRISIGHSSPQRRKQ